MIVAVGVTLAVLAVAGTATADRVYFGEGRLEVPLPYDEDVPDESGVDYDCETYDGCPDRLEGESYHDHHVGPAIESADPSEEDGVGYVLDPEGPLPYIEGWQLCGFDEAGEHLFCDEQSYGHIWMLGELPLETEHVRVTLRPFAPSSYYLDIYA